MSDVRCFICIIIELGSSGLIVDIVISRNLKDGGEIEVFLFCDVIGGWL